MSSKSVVHNGLVYTPDSRALKLYVEMDNMVPTPGYTSFVISPPLPTGLKMGEDGVISGLPLEMFEPKIFTITATSEMGKEEATTINISIEYYTPGLKYSMNEVILRVNERMESLWHTDIYYSFDITPELPKGIELRYDGVIDGTPRVESERIVYTITAINDIEGRVATMVAITITDKQIPLVYHPDTVVIEKNMRMMPMTPTSNYHNFTVNPALPQGILILEDGTISGTPTVECPETIFTVIGFSEEGTISSTTISITVFSNFHYEPSEVVLKVYQLMTPMIPSAKLHTFSISPSLPIGLKLDTSTGIIQGTPTRISNETVYTVNASASGPMTYTTIKITVNENVHPLRYTPDIVILRVSKKMEPMVPTEGFHDFKISPALPKGIQMGEDGVIDGIPEEEMRRAEFTITAVDDDDVETVTSVIITVEKRIKPLKYHPDTVVIEKNMRMMPMTPTSNYHNFTVNPVLPQGILILEDGMITGTPTVECPETIFTVIGFSEEGAISSTTISITVFSNFHYEPSEVVLKVYHSMTPMIPSAKLHTFSISPSLPVGLTIDTSTGIIQGTPTRISNETVYTVNASASGPMTYTTIKITVTHEESNGRIAMIICISIVVILAFILVAYLKLKNRKRDEPLLSSV